MTAFLLAVLGLLAAAYLVDHTRFPRRPGHRDIVDDDGPFIFPDDFLWGAATADHQIEHSQPDDWTAFEEDARAHGRDRARADGNPEPGHIKGILDVPLEVLRKKSDFDTRFLEDLKRARDLGHNAHRFSLSWARLFPRAGMDAPDPEGLSFYQRVVDAVLDNQLMPFVTLFHFASPQWLWTPDAQGKRGLERADAVDAFARFTHAVARSFGDRVIHWCTLNEPMVVVFSGYLEGIFPPNERRDGPPAVRPVVEALLRMHAAAHAALRTEVKGVVQVGVAHHVRRFLPYRNYAPLDRITASYVERAFVTDFLDALHTGTFAPAGAPSTTIEGLRGTMDYVGVNYYGRMYLKSDVLSPQRFAVLPSDGRQDEPSDLGWALDEVGLERALVRLSERYRLPLYVLENGTADAADDDVRRQRGIVRHAVAVHAALAAGADVRGLFHWSLVDNFEWAEGFAPRFGLCAVDYQNGFARTERPSAQVFRAIAESNAVSTELWRRFRRRQ